MLQRLLIGVDCGSMAARFIKESLEEVGRRRRKHAQIFFPQPYAAGIDNVIEQLNDNARDGDAVLLLHENPQSPNSSFNLSKINESEKIETMKQLREKAHVARVGWCVADDVENVTKPNPITDFLKIPKGTPVQIPLSKSYGADRSIENIETLIKWLDEAIQAKT